ncbi:MAG: dihydroorotate dehydrogenase 2 [Alphaproteobacteria bacterium GM202ARS2]|nr:dihydroorotate dehydrogenase 2 [Alphaproteobacteria bacterium GM202ARS2]
MDAERSHSLALQALGLGVASFLAPPLPPIHSRLRRTLFGKTLAHPIALAAGFDKDAVAYQPLHALGFSAIEVGSITPQPHAGNPRPRLWRVKDKAIINSYGLNNKGLTALKRAIAPFKHSHRLLGVSVASIKSTTDAILEDFSHTIDALQESTADYIALNLSCPNVSHGNVAILSPQFLQQLCRLKHHKHWTVPLLLKIPCALEDKTYTAITQLAIKNGFAGLIVGNTSPQHNHAHKGGLSGTPLGTAAEHALAVVHRARKNSKNFVLISSGGVMDGFAAYRRLHKGADMVQIYTAFIYDGLNTLPDFISAMNQACHKKTPSSLPKRTLIRNVA